MNAIKTLGYLLLATLTGVIITFPIIAALIFISWNYCMPTMFGLSMITVMQSLAISFGVDLFSFLFFRPKTLYKFLELVLRGADKVMVIIYYIFIQIVTFLISLNCALYLWNEFIPEMFGITTPHIGALTMIAFVVVFRCVVPSKPGPVDWDAAEKEYKEKQKEILLTAMKEALQKTTDEVDNKTDNKT